MNDEKTKKRTAVVSLSGGMDSAVVLGVAREKGYTNIVAVSFDYGSRHAKREYDAAQQVVAWYEGKGLKINHQRVRLPNVFFTESSALMSDATPMPELTYEELMLEEGPSPTVVPFRNANIISMCTTIALVHNAEVVMVGMHATDAHNWAYPDCTPEFLGAMAAAVLVGSYQKVRLEFPLIWMEKSDVFRIGANLEVPLHLTYSCYLGGETHCGKCPTCVERYEAFRVNGFADEDHYQEVVESSAYMYP